ncbi:pre-mRNA-processing factor 39-like [Pelobates fuscus]|uniref:pre-mRNA-processing factor 39-like n=1 Tax=Pelobates fuscus TaxID=191477 RepID=UPI002FE4CB8E
MAANWRFPSQVPADSEVPLTTEDCTGSDEDSNEAGEPEISDECRHLWDTVMKNPCDFNGWTKLLEHAENQTTLIGNRRIYHAFLTRFPYCYGYWKKYADLEVQFKNQELAEEVFSKALQAIPLSVDLWIHYITFLKSKLDMKLPESVERLRGVFNAALEAAGLDFRSDKLWLLYAQWERDHSFFREAAAIYDRVLTVPTQLYRQQFDRFKGLIAVVSPHEFMRLEEFQWIRSRIIEQESFQVPDEDTESDDLETDHDLQEQIRDHFIKIREQIFLLNEAEVRKRWTFEEAILRPYFHALPLYHSELQNWRKYLEFEISEGHHNRIVTLYERCLVACAHYEEFWLSYAKYMENISVEETSSIFQRACQIHLPKKPTLNFEWAMFEEKHGNLDSARSILCDLETQVPRLAIVRMKRVNLERRNGNLEEAERLLQEAVEKSLGTELAAFYSIKLSRFLLKSREELERAKEVLIQALKEEPGNARLHLYLMETEMSREDSEAENDVMLCAERALQSSLHDNIKKIISQRRLEFLEDYGSNITSLLSAYNEHQKLLVEQEEQTTKAENESSGHIETEKTQNDRLTIAPQCSTHSPIVPTTPYPLILPPGPVMPPPGPVYGASTQSTSMDGCNLWYQNYRQYNPMSWNPHRYFFPQ